MPDLGKSPAAFLLYERRLGALVCLTAHFRSVHFGVFPLEMTLTFQLSFLLPCHQKYKHTNKWMRACPFKKTQILDEVLERAWACLTWHGSEWARVYQRGELLLCMNSALLHTLNILCLLPAHISCQTELQKCSKDAVRSSILRE